MYWALVNSVVIELGVVTRLVGFGDVGKDDCRSAWLATNEAWGPGKMSEFGGTFGIGLSMMVPKLIRLDPAVDPELACSSWLLCTVFCTSSNNCLALVHLKE